MSSQSITPVSNVLGRALSRFGSEKTPEQKEQKELEKDYRKLISSFDSQREKVWQSVRDELKGNDAAARLVETSRYVCHTRSEIIKHTSFI